MKRHIDYYFLAVGVVLLFSGLLFLSTLSTVASLQYFNNTNHYFFHQLMAVGAGLLAGFIVFKLPLRLIKKAVPFFFILNVVALLAVFLPGVGSNYWGASRWINVGGITIQPSEFFKITIILYLAFWISNRLSPSQKSNFIRSVKNEYHNAISVFLPFLVFLAMSTIILYLQRDISTLGIIAISLVVMYFTAKTPLWHTLALILGGIGMVAVFVIIEPYRLQRLLTFLHPESDPLGTGLQLKQSIIAVGSGGWFGKGLGMSTQKFGFLPQAMSDSMFAILGEETGIIGCIILLGLFLAFLYLGCKIAKSSQDTFAKLTAIGITTWITVQAGVNIASVIGIFPVSGLPLPFFSYGGSHMVAELIGMGLLLNISKNG